MVSLGHYGMSSTLDGRRYESVCHLPGLLIAITIKAKVDQLPPYQVP